MAEASETIIDKLEILEQHALKLLQAARLNDWRQAEAELNSTHSALAAVTRFVQLANDIQRGQIR
jgi:flagellar biosynthesis/type III secretory pathway chaperone